MAAMKELRAGRLATGMSLYAATAWLFSNAMRQDEVAGLATANGLWNAFSNVAGAWIGVTMFDEKLSPMKLLGLGLGVASALLLSMKDE